MDIIACGSRPSRRGSATSFTGTVWQDPIIETPSPALLRAGWVRFEPGARTFWHTHPLGQTLAIVSGIGHVQTWGGPIRQVRAGPAEKLARLIEGEPQLVRADLRQLSFDSQPVQAEPQIPAGREHEPKL